MEHATALKLLGADETAHADALRKAFRRRALELHPDKLRQMPGGPGADDTAKFVELQQALETALACVLFTRSDEEVRGMVGAEVDEVLHAYPPAFVAQFRHLLGEVNVNTAGRGARPLSEVLDKRFFGTQFRSDEVDFRVYRAAPDAQYPDVQMVFRCRDCPDPGSSVCARLSKPTKNKCICGHPMGSHVSQRGRCSKCACATFAYHIQQQAWEARCGCKHKHVDHHVTGARKCKKDIPGKRGTPCPCTGYLPSWVCTCGHPTASHETVACYVNLADGSLDRALLGREWVAGGLRAETVALAEDNRARMQRQAVAAVAAHNGDLPRAQADIAAHAQRTGASYVAQAKMYEAAAAAAKPRPKAVEQRRAPAIRPRV